MRRYIGSFKATGTHKNESFAQQSLPISTSLPEEGNAQRRFVSIKAVSPTPPVLCLVTNPFSQGTDALQQIWGNQSLYISIPLYISSILLFSTSLEESQVRPSRKKLLVTPIRQSQIWYTLILEMCIAYPLLLPRNTSLKIPQGEIHPLNGNRTLRLAMWTRSGKDYLRRYDTIKNCR